MHEKLFSEMKIDFFFRCHILKLLFGLETEGISIDHYLRLVYLLKRDESVMKKLGMDGIQFPEHL